MKRISTRKLKEVLREFLLRQEIITACPKCFSTGLGKAKYCMDDRFEPGYYTRECYGCGAETKTDKLIDVELTKARVKRVLGL